MAKGNGIAPEDTEFLGDAEPIRTRGRPKSIDNTIVIENLEPRKPQGARGDPALERADQILFAYMSRGLEMLNSIASCSKLPVAMRQRAAETMVEHGSAIFRGSKGGGKSLPPTPSHFNTDSRPSSDTPAAPGTEAEQIPDGWGEDTTGDLADTVPEVPLDPLPPPPTDLNISQDAQIKKRCEERLIRMLGKYRVCKASKLKGAVMGDRFGEPPLMDLNLLLRDLLAKGVVDKHTDTAGRISYYLKRRPPLPVPTFRVQP